MASYIQQSCIYGRAYMLTLVGAQTARPAAALIVAPKVRLIKRPGWNPTPGNVDVTDLATAECDFVGYAAGGYVPTFSAPVNPAPNVVGILANIVSICTGAAAPSPNTCTGYWVDDGVNVIIAEAFPVGQPVTFVNPGDFLDLTLYLPQQLIQAP